MTGRLRTKQRGAGPEGERADHKPPAAPGALGGAARTTYHLCRERPSISNGSRGSSRARSPGRAEELRLAPGSPRGNRGWGAPRGRPGRGPRRVSTRTQGRAWGSVRLLDWGPSSPGRGFLPWGRGGVLPLRSTLPLPSVCLRGQSGPLRGQRQGVRSRGPPLPLRRWLWEGRGRAPLCSLGLEVRVGAQGGGASPAAVWAFGPDCSMLMTGCGL